jgi:hypothetical protein
MLFYFFTHFNSRNPMPDVYQDDKPTQYNTSHTFFDPKKNLNKKLPFKYHSETEVKINKLYILS